jgi:hypothetical protein
LPVIKENKAKRSTIYCEERGNKRVTQAISSPPPSGDFGAKTREFSEKPRDLWKRLRFEKKVADFRKKVAVLRQTRSSRVLKEPWRIFPESANSLLPLKLMIFSRNPFDKKAA